MGSHEKSRAAVNGSQDIRRVLDAIRRIVQSIRLAGRAAERVSGLSGAQLFVLQKLAEGEATSLNDLAARTVTHQSSVSVVVQKLVDQKLVTRNASAADARRVVLSLTGAGRAVVRKSPQAAQERIIEAVQHLHAAERTQLAKLLERVADRAAGGTAGAEHAPPMLFEDRPQPNRTRKQSNGS
jgi:DNA-binding MarR family transcriptional regulator